ncbi:lytic transglycosylase domain-containing protein [Sphingomonas sp. HF-S4]|uniref:Lytic transglycosylase domain-containing protein n=2 Tax=Sphingomonas agrestis TaxID=3080540 RepID=A0ABU3Y3B8_9SPHN|nr:lytic transglycosylase domain-containing protein [Sphingomonas sp. HF-S4]MDV3455869.1 lytic transglycosylase domain-containing protein [Sphingomonas sp. HF-S4]
MAVASPQAADRMAQWDGLIAEAASRFGIPDDWIRRVMRAESGGRTTLAGRPIASAKGAMGLMQVMPATYAEMARRHGLGADPHAPRDNILAGAAYLRAMYDRFGYPGLFAAYNAGPARYAAHLRTGNPLPGETRIYLARVTGAPLIPPEKRPGLTPAERRIDVFFELRGQRAGQLQGLESSTSPAPRNGIFVQLRAVETTPQ